jgi:hypothetical protein
MKAVSCARKYAMVESNWGQKSYHLIYDLLETGEGCIVSVQVQFSSWRLGTWSTMNTEQKAEQAMTRPREIMITYIHIAIILVQD